jgi:peptidyl-prolyl cis-trans isomerase SurA
MNLLFAFFLAALLMFAPGQARSEVVDKIVAIVNDDIVTLQEVEKFVHVERQQKFSSVHEYLRDLEMKDKLDGFIENLLIRQQAKKYKIEVADKEVEAMIDGMKKQHLITDSELREQLKREGVDYKDFVEGVKMSLVRSRVLARSVSADVLISDKDLQDYFTAHSDEFREEEYKLQHIFVSGQRQDAAQRANEAYNLLREGKPFGEMAKQYSDEPTSSEGGDIGFVKKQDLIPALRNAVSLLTAGNYSNVVRTPYGFHILKLIELKKMESAPFEAVKDRIHQILIMRESEKRYRDYITKVRASSYIEVKI